MDPFVTIDQEQDEFPTNSELVDRLFDALPSYVEYQQPSAWDLCQSLEREFGGKVYWVLRSTIERVLNEASLTRMTRSYFQALLDGEDLAKAIQGTPPPRKGVESTIDHLLHQGKAYRSSGTFMEMVAFMGRFKDYSPFNNMLVKIQNPSCTFFASAKDWWRKHHRRLIDDARPMVILAPMSPVMLVYDLDQTDGTELPEALKNFSKFQGEWESKWLDTLVANAEKRDKIQIQVKTLSTSNSGFATSQVRDPQWKMRIAIHSELDEPSQFGVLCHELAHIHLGHLGTDKDYWWPSRRNLCHAAIEVEAESVAYVVTSRMGLKGNSPNYVSSYLRGDDLPEGVSLDLIAKVSGQIEDMIKHPLPPRKPRPSKS